MARDPAGIGFSQKAPLARARKHVRVLIMLLRRENKKRRKSKTEREREKERKRERERCYEPYEKKNVSFSDVAGKVRDGGCPTTFCEIERKCS